MNYENQLFQYLENLKNNMRVQPMFLGGTASYSGGVGGPPGGFIGFLPQSRIAYDFGELASNDTPISGMSLWDNLNHIRYRIHELETGGVATILILEEDGTVISSGISVINFVGASLVETVPGEVTVTISGGAGGGDMYKSVYDTDNDGIVDVAKSVPWSGISGTPGTFPPEAHNHDDRYYTETELQTSGLASIHYANLTNVPTISGGVIDTSLFIFSEKHSSQCNDVLQIFNTLAYFKEGSTQVFLNGLLQEIDVDYTEGSGLTSITFIDAPLTGDSLIINYIKTGDFPTELTGPYTESGLTELVVMEIHDHTTESDGSLSPADLVARYFANGIEALAISDHNLMTSQPSGIELAINGEEITLAGGHIGSFGITEVPSGVTVQDYITSVVADGGVTVLNHPKWTTGYSLSTMQGLTDYHGIEIFNMYCQYLSGTGFDISDWDSLLTSTRRNIWAFAADDWHTKYYNTASNTGRIIVFSKDRTVEEVLASIKRGDFVADVSNYGVTPGVPTITSNNISVIAIGANRINFIGDNGTLLQSTESDEASYNFSQNDLYVRIEAIGGYEETFDSDVDWGNRWGYNAGSWSVTGGVLRQATDSAASYIAFLNQHILGDTEVLCDLRITGSGAELNAGICLNVTNDANFWMLRLIKNTNEINLYKFVGGASTLIDTASFTVDTNTWYRARIKYVYATGQYQCRVWAVGDTEPSTWQLEATDTSGNRNGMIALRCKCASEFDNLIIDGFKTYYQPIPTGDWA